MIIVEVRRERSLRRGRGRERKCFVILGGRVPFDSRLDNVDGWERISNPIEDINVSSVDTRGA